MKKIISILCISFSLNVFAQDSLKLAIEITNLRSNKGEIRLEIFNKNKKIVQRMATKVIEKKAVFEEILLPKASYAIRYFHDENEDKVFGINYIGIPNEGFGYSNNASAMFGEPDFMDWIFELNKNKSLLLKTSYLF